MLDERSIPAAGLIHLLEDGASLFSELSDEVYTRPDASGSSVGSHFRHVVEFVFELCAGIGNGSIDYSLRKRDQAIEHDRGEAANAFRRAVALLRGITRADLQREIVIVPESFPGIECRTSGLREIDGVQSHTIHHYALIAERLKSDGISVSAEFGVSPSTLRFRESSASSAAGRISQ
jgi:hypothetical protein